MENLRTFIAFRTVGNDVATKKECLDWIWETFLQDSGVTPVRGDVKGAPYLFLPQKDAELLWFGHTDVVPGSTEQFNVRVEGDKAYGRGVKDMKGADLAFLIAYKEACTAGKRPRVSILLTSDEETGGHTPEVLLEQKILGEVPVAFTPDTGETDGIVHELKGAVWVRLVAEGKSGHAAVPWMSKNPVPRLLEAVQSLHKQFPDGAADDWQVTMTPTQIGGSDAMNRIPGQAWCLLDVRFPPTIWKTPTDAFTGLTKLVPSGCRLEQVESAYPMFTDSDHPMIQRLKRIADSVTGTDVRILREHGSSDARFFTAQGIPAFLYGPLGGDLHGANEWVSLRSLDQQVEMNRLLLQDLTPV